MSTRARIGSVVAGKYKLTARLGGGGMGEVFRAEHQYAGRVVALKLLRADFADDLDLTRRFFQEAQAVNKIRHPNIVDVLDAGFSEEGPYVAMEILEGASLAAALARAGKFDLCAALAVVLPMLDALDAAHHHGIVHRDLKPENVFLARTPGDVTVKIVDFGIAKVLDAGTNTNTGIVFGTPDYLSPEQASGEGVVDGRSDLFAVGIVLFELLTGRRPFEAETALATAYRIVHAPAPSLVSAGLALDARVQTALDAALAKTTLERAASAAVLAELLAPLAPDAEARRKALIDVVDAAVGAAPTAVAPGVSPAAETTPPAQPAGQPALAGQTPEARRTAETPVAPPTPVLPAGPTLASHPLPRPAQAYAIPIDQRQAPTLAERTPEPSLRHTPVASNRRTPSPLPARLLATTPARPSPRATPGPPAVVRRTAWNPRPLPAHTRGKCHTRGSVPRAAARWIERALGPDARDDVLRAMPPALADVYRTDGFNALVWYDLDALDTFLEAATALVLGGDAFAWRVLARDSFERDLGPIFGAVRPGDPAASLKRTVSAWSRLYDFGAVRVSSPSTLGGGAQRALVRFDGFDAASLALRNATIGTAEGLVQKGGAGEIATRVLAGESSFVRELEFELAWPQRR